MLYLAATADLKYTNTLQPVICGGKSSGKSARTNVLRKPVRDPDHRRKATTTAREIVNIDAVTGGLSNLENIAGWRAWRV